MYTKLYIKQNNTDQKNKLCGLPIFTENKSTCELS